VAGQASYVDQSLGVSAVGSLSPQALLDNLPANLQPGSTLFYYNPQAEDLMLQQAALQQTGTVLRALATACRDQPSWVWHSS
jgi:filamentous hemagglutinin